MTVSYTSEVTTSSGLGCFLKLLLRWRGSIYKLIWTDLFIFMALYYSINLSYRFAMNDNQKRIFEEIVHYCEEYGNLIPLSFVLGFYVNVVMSRWWNQYTAIPFPDNLALLISAGVKGENDRGRAVRRTIMRYVCLSFTMTLRMISPKVMKRFPTHAHLVEAGLLEKDEKKILEDMDNEFPSYSKYWLPLAWASNLVTRARHEGMIRDDPSVNNILTEINEFRTKCGTLLDHDWISVPLVYTQVVTLAVYTYFITALFSRQFVESHGDEMDLYFPILTILEYFFYVGWLRVAETLINPFGDDDDDFEVVWMIDRHVQVTYLIVDKIHQEHPKLMKDMYWKKMAPNTLPFTVASEKFKTEYPVNSTTTMKVGGVDAEISHPERNEGVDGKRLKHSESFLQKMFRPSKRAARMPTELNKISTEQSNEEGSENESRAELKSNLNVEENDFTAFNNLKKIRRALIKQKIIKCLQVLRNQMEDMERQSLVEQMLSGPSESNLNY